MEEPYEGSVADALEALEDVGVAGVIVIAPLLSMAAPVWNAKVRVPVEMIAAGVSSTPDVVTYSENQELGARMATQHLIDLGHTDIAHFGGSSDWFDARARKRGWEAALRDAGLTPGLYLEGDWTPRWAYETGLRLIEDDELPRAIFAASDHTALGLIRAVDGTRTPRPRGRQRRRIRRRRGIRLLPPAADDGASGLRGAGASERRGAPRGHRGSRGRPSPSGPRS